MTRTANPHHQVWSLAIILVSTSLLLFRRDRAKPARVDAFRDLFAILETLFEASSALKPEWRVQWSERRLTSLPEKYEFGDELAAEAAYTLRYATLLLQRYRWKSVVQPLFETIDEPAWSRFSATAAQLSPALLATSDSRVDGLREDELDWINTAVEQFDDATRRRRTMSSSGTPRSQQVAEGVYQPLYIAIQFSDRLIERLSYDASQR